MNPDELADFLATQVKSYVDAAIAKAVAALPPPIPGPPGPPGGPGVGLVGAKGDVGDRGERGERGTDGKDGRDAKDGRDGRDGKDGIASRDELVSLVSTEVATHLAAEVQKGVAAALAQIPFMVYKGVYREATEYHPGHVVTWGGEMYHCNTATSAKPATSGDWTLAVKKGRDGREPERAKHYPRPPAAT